MHFTKMHGLGNDYLYVYGEVPENIIDICRKLSDRHFGAGSDGMIYISPSHSADFRMRIFNADGSEAKMCGNGIRCVGKYVYDKGYTDKTHLTVETLSGIKTLDLNAEAGRVSSVSVGMGSALEKTGVSYCGGKNAPYIWLKCPNGMESWEFFDYLLNETQIVGTPGAGFGKCGEGYFRFSTFGDPEDTKKAAEKLIKILS